MLHRLVDARYLQAHAIWLRFADGTVGEVDLADQLDGEIFTPLGNAAYFKSFRLHPELRTIVWPNGADFAPEFFRAAVRTAP